MKIDIDKAKEKLTATVASAKDMVSKENIGKASSRIATLKTKEGRQAFIAEIKAMPLRSKIVFSAVAAGLVIVLCCIGSCLFSDSHLDKRLGSGMTRYVMDYQKLQNQLDTAVAKLEKGEGKEEPDLIKRHREATRAAKDIAKYVKETTVPSDVTEAGKEVVVLISEIALVQSNLWVRLHHVMPLTAESVEQSSSSNAQDNEKDMSVQGVSQRSNLENSRKEDLADEIDHYRKKFGNGEGDRYLFEFYGANAKFMFTKAGRKMSKYASMPEELAEKMVKEIESDLNYMASDERCNGQIQRRSSSYKVMFDSDAERIRADTYNKLQEYDEFKGKARAAARKQSDELKTKLQKLNVLLVAPSSK